MTKLLNILKGTKERPSVLHTPTLKHTWKHTLSLYPSDKSRKPVFSITAKDDKSVSVLKLALILLAVVCAVILTARLVKRIREKLGAKKRDAAHSCCDDCLYARIEE